MKKFFVGIVVTVLLAAGIWYYLKPQPVGTVPADLLPKDTLLLIEFVDLEKSIDDFKKGKLGQKLKGIDLTKVMLELEVDKGIIEEYKKVETSVLSAIDSMLFKELFGKEAVIAVLPAKIDDFKLNDLKKAIGSIVLISRPKHNADFTEFITRYLAKGTECRVEEYAGYKIKNFRLNNGFSIYYLLKDGLLIASPDSLSIKNCILSKSNQKESLKKNKNYQDLRHKLVSKSIRSFVYNNIEKTYDYILNIAQFIGGDKENLAAIEHLSASFKGLKTMGYASSDNRSDLLHDKMLVMFDKTKMELAYAKPYGFKPSENKTIHMVPKKTICYYWTNTMDFEFLFSIFSEKILHGGKTGEPDAAEFEKKFGCSLDEIFQALGNQFGFILTDIDVDGLFPVPKLTIFFEVKKQEVLTKFFESAIQKTKIGFEEEKFEDVEINNIALPAFIGIQPSYAFYNDFCMVSINRKMIKDIITVSNNGEGLISNDDFQKVNKGLTAKNNNIAFIKFDDLIDEIKELWKWGFSMTASKNQDIGVKCKIITDGVIYPFLDGLKMYKTIGTRSIIKKNEIESEFYFNLI